MDNKLISKWEKTGLLHGCTSPEQRTELSNALEFFAGYLLQHEELSSKVRSLALPTLTRIYNQKPHNIFLLECIKIIKCLETAIAVPAKPTYYAIDAEIELVELAVELYFKYEHIVGTETSNDTV